MRDDTSKVTTEKWLKYILMILMAIFAGFVVWFVANRVQDTDVMAIPRDYYFVVAEGTESNQSIYYVYDGKIMLETKKQDDNGQYASTILVYDGVNTSEIAYAGDDATTVCLVSECKSKKKTLATVKKALSGHAGREYIGR